MSGNYPGVILSLLAAVEEAWTKHIDENSETDLQYWFPLGLSVESHGEHVATLFDEGWSFEKPQSEPAVDESLLTKVR